MPASAPTPSCVDDVIVAPAPAPELKTSRVTDALLRLSQSLAQEPDLAVQRLVETAMELTKADSAGVSLEEDDATQFRWIATAGEFSRYLNGTMPRDFSPCGTVLDRGRSLVMREPHRHFHYIADLVHVPIKSVLLVPFGRRGKLVGTVWVATHRGERSFTERDLRAVQDLTTFATAILDARSRV